MISAFARRAAIRLVQNEATFSSVLMRSRLSTAATFARPFATRTDDVSSPIPPPKASADSDIPSIFDQATGLERAEIENPEIFKHNEVLRGPFGTLDNPVKIPSHYDSRIVGCTGRPSPDDHEIVWIVAKKDEKSCCPSCNQYFEIMPL